jgi:hypothetical protein
MKLQQKHKASAVDEQGRYAAGSEAFVQKSLNLLILSNDAELFRATDKFFTRLSSTMLEARHWPVVRGEKESGLLAIFFAHEFCGQFVLCVSERQQL